MVPPPVVAVPVVADPVVAEPVVADPVVPEPVVEPPPPPPPLDFGGLCGLLLSDGRDATGTTAGIDCVEAWGVSRDTLLADALDEDLVARPMANAETNADAAAASTTAAITA